jgi:isopentenyl diphosphate isomerase/L-lactate dehydrogenase-like FMN-dependent dehydrogenase
MDDDLIGGIKMAEVIKGGDSVKITRDYFESLLLELRYIDSVEPSTTFSLYGEVFETPVMSAALSHLNETHPEGLVELARGIKASGAVMWVGIGDEAELENITATGARTIKIIKPYADNKDVFKKIEHAEKCGCLAVGMDIDHSFNSKGRPDKVSGFQMAPKSLSEIKSFVKTTKLPFIIKGVLSENDAQKCLDAGVEGIVVSHHHGIVPYSVPPLLILPKIVKLINRQIPIFVDCGIERGMDVFKALALGANAVSVGRALMPPLASEGAAGIQKVIEEITNELRKALAVTGSRNINQIDPDVLWRI